MKAIIENHKITIFSPTESFKRFLSDNLSYTDKSKDYQIRKMEKNIFHRNSSVLKKLKQEASGTLLKINPDESLEIPSGFAHLLKNIAIEDKRIASGDDIVLPWANKPFDTRDYQQESVNLMCSNYRGLINLATSLGKTLTTIYAVKSIKKKTLIVCPGKSIAENFYTEMVKAFGEHKVGYFGDGKKQIKDITIGIVQSVLNSIELFQKQNLGLVVFDETHHLAANTFFSLASSLSHVGRMFGLTATDFRSDGKDIIMTAGVGEVLIKRDSIWGIKEGWLANPHFLVREVETSGKIYKDDKLKNYKSHVLNSNEMNTRIINDVQKFLNAGKSVLCLVDQVEHGNMIAKAVGVPFATGEDKISSSYIVDLNKGKIPGLIGTSKYIGEGCDTRNVDVLILANFVASKGTLWQNIGRGLRKQDVKTDVIILDYIPVKCGMLKRHGDFRIKCYKEITDNVKVIKCE